MRTPKITQPSKLILLLVFAFTLFSCNDSEDDSQPYITAPPTKGKVLIVGAGASGLQAGKMLKDEGYDVSIMEASDKIGGRLRKNTTLADMDLDMGAETIYGNTSDAFQLATNYGQNLNEDTMQPEYWYNNQMYKGDETLAPRDLKEIINYIYNGHGQTNQSFEDWADQEGMDSSYDELIEALANMYGGSAEHVSVPAELQESLKSTTNDQKFRLRDKTMYDLVNDHLAPYLEENIKLNAPVSKIDYTGDKVYVTAGQNIYDVDKVIVTVPIKVLQNEYIQFVPPMGDGKKAAINNIGMEECIKVFIKFNENFFEDNMIVGGRDGSMYYDATHGKDTDDAVIGVQVTGKNAAELSALDEDHMVQRLLAELDAMYDGKATQTYSGQYVMQDWGKEEFVQGAFSYEKANTGNLRETLAAPIAKKVYFAGEATNLNGNKGTVSGALESGVREANRVMADFE
ncbi:flavin monoamine oxidase family protein [Aureivirga sp. CE67]|uniref:flavin monoamine oxidase family protein n=1 Tax=Aureivirga sp. CE67 TaxID=1788983 RepID=UPI0018CA901F|nr:NAD(P)/FAD-dependent oxidoreductase [Aureivirga sp. CE67]